MALGLDSFEHRILKRVFANFALLFLAYYCYELIMATTRAAAAAELVFWGSGIFLNGAALAVCVGLLSHKDCLLPVGVVFTLANVALRQAAVFFVPENMAASAVSALVYPMAALGLGFYTRRAWIPVAVSLYILASFLLVHFAFPSFFFRHGMPASPGEIAILRSALKVLVMGLLTAVIISSLNQLLYASRQHKQEYFKKLSHYDQETGLPNIRELSVVTNGKIERTDTESSVLVLAGIRIVKLEELSERLGYENMVNWLLRFSSELTASLDLWRRGTSGTGADETFQLFRLESSLLIFPVEVPKELYADASKLCEAWTKIVLDVLRAEHIESLIDFYGAVTAYPDDGKTSSELLNNVLNILHRSTADLRTVFIPFNASAFDQYLRKERLKEQMTSDSFASEVFTVFQPKVSTRDGTCREFEALGRWKNPILGLISPGEFIPLAEQIGTIGVATKKSLEDVLRFIERSREAGFERIKVSFNLSPALISGDYLTALAAWIHNNRLGQSLEIEITEGILLNTTTELEQDFAIIRETGVSFAIDDFGTGYSNLSYLQKFNADVIKIDKSFIDRIPADEKSVNLIKAIILMIRAFGMTCVAEGVETEAQLEFLREAGCDLIQGYYYSKPIPADDAIRFMEMRNAKEALHEET